MTSATNTASADANSWHDDRLDARAGVREARAGDQNDRQSQDEGRQQDAEHRAPRPQNDGARRSCTHAARTLTARSVTRGVSPPGVGRRVGAPARDWTKAGCARPTTAPATTQVGVAYHAPRSAVSAVLAITWWMQNDHERQQAEAHQRQQDEDGHMVISTMRDVARVRPSSAPITSDEQRMTAPPPAPAGAAAGGARHTAPSAAAS